MEHWHGIETARGIAQIHETTIADMGSDLMSTSYADTSTSLHCGQRNESGKGGRKYGSFSRDAGDCPHANV